MLNGPVFLVNRDRRHSKDIFRGKLYRKLPVLHRHLIHYSNRVGRRHIVIPIAMTSHQEVTGPRPDGHSQGQCHHIILNRAHTETQRHHEGTVVRRTELVLPAVPSSRRARTDRPDPIHHGTRLHRDLLAHQTRDHRSLHTRVTSAEALHSLLVTRRARLAQEQHRVQEDSLRRRIRSTLLTYRPDRNHRTRATHRRPGQRSRPRRTPMIKIPI